MMKLKPISLYDWFGVSTGAFFMGLGLGLTLGNFSTGPILFFVGFILEIPALFAFKRHKTDKNQP